MRFKSLSFDAAEQTRVIRDITLSEGELEYLGLLPRNRMPSRFFEDGITISSGASDRATTIGAIFRGSKLRTKFSFACKMYDQEMKQWIEEEDAAEKLSQLSKDSVGRRRAFSCKV